MDIKDIKKDIERLRHVTCDTELEADTMGKLLAVYEAARNAVGLYSNGAAAKSVKDGGMVSLGEAIAEVEALL